MNLMQHYKLSNKPIEAGCYVLVVRGAMKGEVCKVESTLNGILWTKGLVLRERTLWGAAMVVRIYDGIALRLREGEIR